MRVRRAVVRSFGVVLVPVAALTLAGCGDDGTQTWVTGTSAPATTTTTTTTTEAPATDEADAEVAIPFDARLSVSDGSPWLVVELTGDLPEGTATVAVRVDGRIHARTNASVDGPVGFAVAEPVSGEPVEVSVVAEGADRRTIAESAPVRLTQ